MPDVKFKAGPGKRRGGPSLPKPTNKLAGNKHGRDDSSSDEGSSSESDDDVPQRAPGEVRVLSANTCGLNPSKMKKLKTMVENHDLDVLMIQEGCSAQELAKIAPAKEWKTQIVTSEACRAPTIAIGDKTYTPVQGVSSGRTYIAAVRKGSAVDCTKLDYNPEHSESVKKALGGAQATTSRGRTTTAPINDAVLKSLGQRPPQLCVLKLPGYEPVDFYNNHAPQGGGSEKGYSGMDAKPGHQLLKMVIDGRPSTNTVVSGDQNAHRASMKKHYPDSDIISAGKSDPVSHAACTPGLKAKTIDLGGEGNSFNKKGDPACSDHAAFAFSIQLPKEKN